jgi:general secretion pathway protein D
VLLTFRRSLSIGIVAALALPSLAACTKSAPPVAETVSTLPPKLQDQVGEDPPIAVIPGTTAEKRRKPLIEPGPAPPSGPTETASNLGPLEQLKGDVPTVSVEQLPIPAFVNTVLGETLHLTFEVDPKVTAKTDLVTLRTGGPKSAQELLAITREVLRTYGVQLTYEQGVARVRLNETMATEMPQIIIGRGGADVAPSLRPIFQVVVLNQINNQDMASLLSTAFGGKIKFIPFPVSNSIILLGLADDVRAASESIRLLDQPRLAGRHSLKVTPVFWTAQGLSEKLGELLAAEGYNVSNAPVPAAAVTIIPVGAAGTIFIFAGDQKILDHAADVVRDLDQPAQVDPRQAVFVYSVRNTTSDSLIKVLNEVLNGGDAAGAVGKGTSSDLQQPALLANPGSGAPAATKGGNVRFISDAARNALIFLGGAEAYAQVLPLVQSLDQAPREALIEVTVAQVQLSDEQSLGIEFQNIARLGGGNLSNIIGGGGATPAAAGLNIVITNAGQGVTQILTALQQTMKTKVVSTPRLLARSGATAKFQVGTDIPIITGQQTTSSSFVPGGNVFQSVTYRSTGTIISVKPVIYGGNQVDLDISQENSAAEGGNATVAGGSPPISEQNVTTQLSLMDGQTVLLGGFISEQKSDTDNGVPYLKDLPAVGPLFRSTDVSVTRMETLIFITPFIISSSTDSQRIVDSVRETMKNDPVLRENVLQ